MDNMTLIHQYELGYLSQEMFFEQLLGSGQQLIAAEGLERYVFYLQCEASRIDCRYFIESYRKRMVSLS